MMNNEELVKEFKRWVEADRPQVWFKGPDMDTWKLTAGVHTPSWSHNFTYIVNDRHSEIRKQKVDNPDLIIEFYDKVINKWVVIDNPGWLLDIEYHIKEPKSTTLYEWMYKEEGRWCIDDDLLTEEEAKEQYSDYSEYKKTGREFTVEE
jgi:hypothetical protein